MAERGGCGVRGCHREGGRRLTKDSDSEVGCVYCVVVRPKRFTMDWRMHTAVISRSSSSLHKISLLRETEKNVHVYAYVHENGVGSKKFGGGLVGWLKGRELQSVMRSFARSMSGRWTTECRPSARARSTASWCLQRRAVSLPMTS